MFKLVNLQYAMNASAGSPHSLPGASRSFLSFVFPITCVFAKYHPVHLPIILRIALRVSRATIFVRSRWIATLKHVTRNKLLQLFHTISFPILGLLRCTMADSASIFPHSIAHPASPDHFPGRHKVIVQGSIPSKWSLVYQKVKQSLPRHFKRELYRVGSKIHLVLDQPATVHAQPDDGSE